MSLIESVDLTILEKFLDESLKKQSVIASNIANANTPNYKAKELNFEEAFKKALGDGEDNVSLKATDPRHFTDSNSLENLSTKVEISSAPARPDGNNVNLEKEMVKLTENNISYNLGIQLITKKLKDIRTAITSGRR